MLLLISCFVCFLLGYVCCAMLSSHKEGTTIYGRSGDSVRVLMSDGTTKTYILATTWHIGDEYVVLQVSEGSKNVTFAVKAEKATIAFKM